MTPLHLALSKGHADVAAELVERGTLFKWIFHHLIPIGAIQKYNKRGEVPLDMASESTLSRLQDLLGPERFERLKSVDDTMKNIKPPVPFYNRKKKTKGDSSVARDDKESIEQAVNDAVYDLPAHLTYTSTLDYISMMDTENGSLSGNQPDSENSQLVLTFNKKSPHFRRITEFFETVPLPLFPTKFTQCDINITVPLPLKNKWVIWEQIVKGGDHRHNTDYKCHTRPLVAFDTVQSFWNLWFNIPQPSELSTTRRLSRECKDGSEHVVDAIMLFRDGIEPMWEDEMNKDGGHFDYRFKPTDVSQITVDEYWNNIVLGLIGCSIPHANLINGIRLVDKLAIRFPVVRIEVWFRNLGEDNDATQLMKSIGTCMARRLDGTVGPIPKGDLKWH
ncbi:Eukaryotic translation initiation factor NCBP [Babesia sp. Xinjiang]|uniref:Eukaryotic translation initiation factor NCBP n=1 Tax=Babesia sp. Xinjiang TaxID=462227 RepID=UPI000A2571CA|nr:Eukaryotic translation initiation factor NCBP [Babesia sp. Xinjiang]ORM41599.1 Eukaryotic translation initiation factor NCBP [Babesia sp. Xinjiang]